MTSKRTNRLHVVRGTGWLFGALLLAVCSSGCRGHTAAGCAGGTAVGMLIGAVSAAAADSDVDVGAAVLGGGILGVASGCTGAGIVDMMQAKDERAQQRYELPPPAPLYAPAKPAAAAPRAPDGMILETVELDGLRVLWVAHPKRYPTQVGMRFERYARVPTLVDCTTLELMVDGRSLRFALTGEATPKGMLVLETAKSTIALDDARSVGAGSAVELELCGLHRRFSARAAEKLASFVKRFDELAPPASSAPLPPALPPAEPAAAASLPAPGATGSAASGSTATAAPAGAVPPAPVGTVDPAVPPPAPAAYQSSPARRPAPAAGTAVSGSSPPAANPPPAAKPAAPPTAKPAAPPAAQP